MVAQRGRLSDVFGYAVVQAHLRPLEERHIGAHIVEDGGCLEGVFDVDAALVVFGEFEELLACFGEAGDDEGIHLFAGRDVHAAAHAHHGVQRGAHGAGQRTSAFDDIGML